MNHVDKGGAALALYDLINEIIYNETDIEPIVITGKKNELNRMLDEIGVENYTASFKNFISSYHSPVFLWKMAYFFRYYINREKAIKKINKYVDLDNIDIIHSNLDRIDIGAVIAKRYHIPHVWHVREYGKDGFRLLSFKQDPIKYMNSFKSVYVFISNAVKDNWVELGLDCSNSIMIYDGIRTELYHEKIAKNGQLIKGIFIGGYCDSKGQSELIEALGLLSTKTLEKFKVDFFGNGRQAYINKLKARAKQLGIEKNVTFNSYDPYIFQKIVDYDIGFNCSISEGFGRVTVEYMLNELCPIVSSGGANREIIKAYDSGFVYEKGNLEDLAMIVQHAIDNQNEIISIGQNAKIRACKLFTINSHEKQIVSLYKKVIKENGKVS